MGMDFSKIRALTAGEIARSPCRLVSSGAKAGVGAIAATNILTVAGSPFHITVRIRLSFRRRSAA